MSSNHVIKPETLNILGGSRAATATQSPPVQAEPPQRKTWWEQVKSTVKKGLEALVFVRDTIVPIMIATASILNVWNNLRRYTGNMGCATCAA